MLYYQVVDIDLPALGLRSPGPEPMAQSEPLTEPVLHLQPTDSPVSTAQSTPPLPPGLAEDDLTNIASVPEALPRPITPPIPIQAPIEPPEKSPRKVPSQFFKVSLGRPATVGRKASHNGAVIRASQDDKFNTLPKPPLSPITIFPKEDLRHLDGPSAGAVNGKEKDSDRSMMGWLLRRSVKGSKSRSSSEVNADMQDGHGIPGSPVQDQSTSLSSQSSKGSRRGHDSPTPGHASPRLSPLSAGKLPSQSRSADTSPYETESRQSSASGGSHTTPISPPERRSQTRPLPAIPASPQTPNGETSSPFTATGSDHSRVQRQHSTSSTRNSKFSLSPRSPSRPATSAGAPTKIRSPLPSAPPSAGLSPKISKGRLDSHKETVDRPKSAHASYGSALSSPTSPVPPLPVSATPVATTRRTGTRKLSLSAPILGFVRRDKDKR